MYSHEQKEMIRDCASNLMKISDIAALIDVDTDELRLEISNPQSEISRIYRRAKAQTIFDMRKAEIELARAGSPLAVQLVGHYVNDMEDEEDL